MLDKTGLERVLGISQLFIQRDARGAIKLLIAKVTDEFLLGDLLGGSQRDMQIFIDKLKRRFEVWKVIRDDKIHFDGCEIEQEDNNDIITFFFESKHFIYSVRNVHSRETEQHYLNIVM